MNLRVLINSITGAIHTYSISVPNGTKAVPGSPSKDQLKSGVGKDYLKVYASHESYTRFLRNTVENIGLSHPRSHFLYFLEKQVLFLKEQFDRQKPFSEEFFENYKKQLSCLFKQFKLLLITPKNIQCRVKVARLDSSTSTEQEVSLCGLSEPSSYLFSTSLCASGMVLAEQVMAPFGLNKESPDEKIDELAASLCEAHQNQLIIKELKEKNHGLQERIASELSYIGTLKSRNNQLQELLPKNSLTEVLEENNKELKEQLGAKHLLVEILEKGNNELKEQLASKCFFAESLREENLLLQEQLEKITKANDAFIENLKGKNGNLEEKSAQLEEMSEVLKAENLSLRAENEHLRTENHSLKAESQNLKTENQSLKKLPNLFFPDPKSGLSADTYMQMIVKRVKEDPILREIREINPQGLIKCYPVSLNSQSKKSGHFQAVPADFLETTCFTLALCLCVFSRALEEPRSILSQNPHIGYVITIFGEYLNICEKAALQEPLSSDTSKKFKR